MRERITPSLWTPAGGIVLEPEAMRIVRSRCTMAIMAGPGAGKTEVLAQRACFLLQTGNCPAPRRILAISFKRDARKNLQERVEQRCGKELAQRFTSHTFDSFAKNLLDRFLCALPPRFRPTPDYEVVNVPDSELKRYLEELNPPAEVGSEQELLALTAKAFDRDVFLQYPTGNLEGSIESVVVWAAEQRWMQMLHGQRVSRLTFDMIKSLAVLALRSNPHVLRALQTTYSHVFLDEFQDTTDLQYDLLTTAFQGTDAILTAVGDPKQRIMMWANAIPEAFQRFTNDFKAAQGKLLMNHRSSPELVAIQRHIVAEIEADALTQNTLCSSPRAREVCQAVSFSNPEEEAEWAANEIKTLIAQGIAPREICVLVKQQPDLYASPLVIALRNIGIKGRVEVAQQDLQAEPLTSFLLSVMRLALLERAPQDWRQLMDLWYTVRGETGDDDDPSQAEEALSRLARRLGQRFEREATSGVAVETLFEAVIAYFGESALRQQYPQYHQGDFFRQVRRQIAEGLWSSFEMEKNWLAAIADFEGKYAVPIMTIHKSKGLEYHTVLFLGLEDGAFWSFDKQSDEDRCAFFVAFSRAKERVIFTFSSQRDGKYGRSSQRRNKIASLYEILARAGVELQTPNTGG